MVWVGGGGGGAVLFRWDLICLFVEVFFLSTAGSFSLEFLFIVSAKEWKC